MTTVFMEFGWVLAGFGALAAGIGVFRAGFALGRAVGRATETLETVVEKHLEGQDKIIALAEKGAAALNNIQDHQEELRRELRQNDTSMRALWQEFRAAQTDSSDKGESR